MKKIMSAISLTCIVLLLSCSKPDPMNMPIKAATLEEYEDSIVKITKAMKDPTDRENFLEALEIVAVGPKAIIEKALPDRGGYEYEKKLEELVKKFDGKTPREMIALAEKWKEYPSQDPKTFLEEMLEPTKKQARESDAALRASRGTIINSLNRLKVSKERWIERKNAEANAIPTKEDIVAEFGEQSWPQSDFPPGAEYILTPEGEPACIINGETITLETRSLYEKLQYE